VEAVGTSSLPLPSGVWPNNTVRTGVPSPAPRRAVAGQLHASWARWENCQDEPRGGGLYPKHFQAEGGLPPRGVGLMVGCSVVQYLFWDV